MVTVLSVIAMLGLVVLIVGAVVFLMKKPQGATLMVAGALVWAVITVILWLISLF